MNEVALVRCTDYDRAAVERAVERVFSLCGGAERFAPRLTELSAGRLEMAAAGEEFLPGPREEAR